MGTIRDNKRYPVLVSFNTSGSRDNILRNREEMPADIYIKEKFSKEVLEIRNNLLPKLQEERKRGRIAYLKKDKLIVKYPIKITKKRGMKVHKTNILTYVARIKSQPISRTHST